MIEFNYNLTKSWQKSKEKYVFLRCRTRRLSLQRTLWRHGFFCFVFVFLQYYYTTVQFVLNFMCILNQYILFFLVPYGSGTGTGPGSATLPGAKPLKPPSTWSLSSITLFWPIFKKRVKTIMILFVCVVLKISAGLYFCLSYTLQWREVQESLWRVIFL